MLYYKSETYFREIFDQYFPMVRSVIFNMTGSTQVDDLTQESFLKIWQALPSFHFKSTLKTWIYRITINVCIDHLRKKSISADGILPDDYSDLKDHTQLTHDQQMIQVMLNQMPPEQKSILVLFYLEEKNVFDISNVLEIPIGTVKSRLHLARAKAFDILKDHEVEL